MAQDLLLEIGVEKLSASLLSSALHALPRVLEGELHALRLGYDRVWAGVAPHRLAVRAAGVTEMQADIDAEIVGPPLRIAFDPDGNPTTSARNFADKCGVSVVDLYRVERAGRDYVAARKRAAGVPSVDLLPALLGRVCAELFSAGRVGDGETLGQARWLLALFGAEVVRVEFGGKVASNLTFTTATAEPLSIAHARDYEAELERVGTVIDVAKRERQLNLELRAAAEEQKATLVNDEALVFENTLLVENPGVCIEQFDARYLVLPERIVLEVARDPQRCFAVRAREGTLLPLCLAVVNKGREARDEGQLRARLASAEALYTQDLSKPLDEWRSELDALSYHERLGSLGAKVIRLEALAPLVAHELGLSQEIVTQVKLAAGLCKSDSNTSIVRAFPQLRGEMGRIYARASGASVAVADAIAEHYWPKINTGPVAPSTVGAVLAVADRLDILVGGCAVNLVPAATSDPLAMRAAAIGLLRTLITKHWDVSLGALVALAHGCYSGLKLDLDLPAVTHKLGGFLRHRLRGLLLARYSEEAVDARLAVDATRPYVVARQLADSSERELE
jgi:glycyl-tRNA synthetase beta chain